MNTKKSYLTVWEIIRFDLEAFDIDPEAIRKKYQEKLDKARIMWKDGWK